MSVKCTNNAWGTLSVGLSTVDLTVLLSSSQGTRFPAIAANSGDCFYITVINDSNELEIMKVVAKTNDTLTVERAQGGTSAKNFLSGCRVELRPTAELFDAKVDYDVYEAAQEAQDEVVQELSDDAVRISKMILTEAQKAQIRENIDAPGIYDSSNSLSGNLKVTGTLTQTGDATLNGAVTINNQLNQNGLLYIGQNGTTTQNSYAIQGKMASNDYWRIIGLCSDSNADAGSLEIATADNGNEPIYVRQYSGTFATISRTLTLLDASGNTVVPGKLTASTYQSTSDKRLKRDFEDLTNVDTALKAITGKKYLRADMPHVRDKFVGVIAQDVQEVIPEAVSENDLGYLSVDYNALVAYLIEGYKALAARVEALEAKKTTRKVTK